MIALLTGFILHVNDASTGWWVAYWLAVLLTIIGEWK